MKIKAILISLILALLLSACGNRDITLPTPTIEAHQGSTPADLEIIEWQE